MNLAIIGATGNVGRKTIEVLEKSNIKIKNTKYQETHQELENTTIWKLKTWDIWGLRMARIDPSRQASMTECGIAYIIYHPEPTY